MNKSFINKIYNYLSFVSHLKMGFLLTKKRLCFAHVKKIKNALQYRHLFDKVLSKEIAMRKLCRKVKNPVAIGDFFPLVSLLIAIPVC